jgi:hypothetical protein
MPDYHSAFNPGEHVRFANEEVLRNFQQSWKWHHPLADEQLAWANKRDSIKSVGYYHGGTPLYAFNTAPGIWHESCILDTTLDPNYDKEAGVIAADYYTINHERRNNLPVVVVRDPANREVLVAFNFSAERVAEAMSAVARVRSRICFEGKYGFGGIYESNKKYLDTPDK